MADVGWTLIHDRAEWAGAVLDFLRGDPIGNTVVVGVAASTPTSRRTPVPADCYGWWTDESGHIRAVLSSMPPHALVLSSHVPAAALAELPAAWLDSGRSRPEGVFGQVDAARALCEAWAESQGIDFRIRPQHEMRLFSFDEPTPPNPAPAGESRLATLEDLPVVLPWDVAFAEECGLPPADDPEVYARPRIEQGRQMLWIDGGEPVATALYAPIVGGSSRIMGVYTPPGRRRRGYAAGATWAVAHEVIRRGAEHVLLHTDLSNPTSNAVYQRLGFRRVHDVTEFAFID